MIPAPYSSYHPQFYKHLNIQKLIERHQLEKILQDWEINATRDLQKAKKNLLDFHSNETTITSCNQPKNLNLSDCQIDSLPNIFIYPPFLDLVQINLSCNMLTDLPNMDKLINLKVLNLSNNDLGIIPATIFSLQSLANLDLSYNLLNECPDLGLLQNLVVLNFIGNSLTKLPEGIDRLSKLTTLRLSENPIDEFPLNRLFPPNLQILCLNDLGSNIVLDSINVPTSLISLDISDNGITSLPSSIGNLSNLKILNISFNALEILPDSLAGLQNLQIIKIDCNNLTRFPEILLTLNQLKHIGLEGNQLTVIPDLHQLTNLKLIDLSMNRLRTLPEYIYQLNEELSINVEENSFTAREVERIQAIVEQINYTGPDIIGLSIEESDLEDLSGDNIEQLCNVLYEIAELPAKNLSNLPNDSATLQSWLERIGHISEFRTASNKKNVAITILSFLEKANEDVSFKDVFLQVIQEASRTCGDRMALSILKLDIYHQIENADLTNTLQFSDLLLRGVYAIDLLEKCARKKLEQQNANDDIETYLAYPIQLKEDLKLPFTVSAMRYFACSQVTDADLMEAKNIVIKNLDNEQNCISFLAEQVLWQKSLSLMYPKEWKKIENKKDAKLNKIAPDYERIKNIFSKDVENLTAIVLSNPTKLTEQFLDNPLEGISNCLEKSKFNVQLATRELILQRDKILSKIFTNTENVECNLFMVEALLAALCFLYEQTSEEDLLLFLFPSSDRSNNIFSISSCIRDVLRRNSGHLYAYLFCKLIEKQTSSEEFIEKLSISEKNPLNKVSKKLNFLTRLTILTQLAIMEEAQENIDSNLISNLIPILTSIERFVSSKERYSYRDKKRFKGSLTENLKKLSVLFEKLKKTIHIDTPKANIEIEKIGYTRDDLLSLVKIYYKLEETKIKIADLIKNDDLLAEQASTSHCSKQYSEKETLLMEQKLLTKKLEELLIEKKNLKETKLSPLCIFFGTFLSKIIRPVPKKISPVNISYPVQPIPRDNSPPLYGSSIPIQQITSSDIASTSRLDTRSLDLPAIPNNELERSERTIAIRTAMMDPIYYKKI